TGTPGAVARTFFLMLLFLLIGVVSPVPLRGGRTVRRGIRGFFLRWRIEQGLKGQGLIRLVDGHRGRRRRQERYVQIPFGFLGGGRRRRQLGQWRRLGPARGGGRGWRRCCRGFRSPDHHTGACKGGFHHGDQRIGGNEGLLQNAVRTDAL